jgi:hypothetical protein
VLELIFNQVGKESRPPVSTAPAAVMRTQWTQMEVATPECPQTGSREYDRDRLVSLDIVRRSRERAGIRGAAPG